MLNFFETIAPGILKSKVGKQFTLMDGDFRPLFPLCDIITCLEDKFIAIKIGSTVEVFSPCLVASEDGKEKKLKRLVKMETEPGVHASLKLYLEENPYLIDENAQISLCSCHKKLH